MAKPGNYKDTTKKIEADPRGKTASRKGTWILIPKPSEQTRNQLIRLGFVVPKKVSRKFATKEVSKWRALFELTTTAAQLRQKYTEACLPAGWQYQDMDGGPGIEINDERGRARVYVVPEETVIRTFYSVLLVETTAHVSSEKRVGKMYCVARSAEGKDLKGTRSAVIDNPLRMLKLCWTASDARSRIGLYNQKLRQIFKETEGHLCRMRPKCNDPTTDWDELDA